MIKIYGAKNARDELIKVLEIDSDLNREIDATGLHILPGLIDPHVHFRIPGQAHKEDWRTASEAALCGGYTTVVDMPNNIPACVSLERLVQKENLIQQQLAEVNSPLHYFLYLGADRKHFDQIGLIKDQIRQHPEKNKIIGIKVFMGASTGDLLMEDESSLHAIFALAKFYNFLIAVHAEDNGIIQACSQQYLHTQNFADHSKIRSREAAIKSVKLALNLAQRYGVRLYILHISTREELALIQEAKQEGVDVFAEVCPHHLFLNTGDYENLKGLAKMNPPLRDPEDQAALIQAIQSGLIDTLGSDHAPHTLEEKNQSYERCPSGVPGIETNLPLLLNAVNEQKLTLQQVENLTVHGPRRLLNLKPNQDWVLIDLQKTQPVLIQNLKTKCGWSPFAGKVLKGWPVMTICRGKPFEF